MVFLMFYPVLNIDVEYTTNIVNYKTVVTVTI